MRVSCQQQHRHRIAKSSILTQHLYCEMLYIDTDIML